MVEIFLVLAAVGAVAAVWLWSQRKVRVLELACHEAELHAQAEQARIAILQAQLQQYEQREQRAEEEVAALRNLLSEANQRMGMLGAKAQRTAELEQQLAALQQQLRMTAERLAARDEQARQWQQWQVESQQQKDMLRQQQDELLRISVRTQELEVLLQQERQQHAEKLRLLEEARSSMGQEFKLLANDILSEKSRVFAEQSQVNLNRLIEPLGERLQHFGKLVQDTHEKDVRDRLTLEQELKRLQLLSTRLNEDAVALTNALTGANNKAQGNWGEMILERVLESSGLARGREYELQLSDYQHDEDGSARRFQPDVVINLPEGKHLVIDSKVSLNAYVRHGNAETVPEREAALKAHIQALRQHIRTLSEKRYQDLYSLQTVDFVFMFIPVEPAYLLAVQNDLDLFNEAFERRIVIVGPSTLLATLRTVASIWRYENQNQHAQEIARQGGLMYDKFASFLESVQKLGKQLDSAQDGYQQLLRQLSTGSGNLLARAEKMRKLGARSSKQLPPAFGNAVEEITDEIDD